MRLLNPSVLLPACYVVLNLPRSEAISNPAAAAVESLQRGMSNRGLACSSSFTPVLGSDSAQATFIVPLSEAGNEYLVSHGRLISSSAVSDHDFQDFDFQTFASNTSCGSSNIILNGVSLNHTWQSTDIHTLGEASIASSGRKLDVWWILHCLTNENLGFDNAAQLLTVTIGKVDDQITHSLSGFTISFTQTSQPELLRLSTFPDYAAISPPEADSWRDPPSTLRLSIADRDETQLEVSTTPSITDHIEELRLLEAEAEALQDLINTKHNYIHTILGKEAESLKEEVHQCDGWICAIKAIFRKARGAAKLVYLKLRPNPHREEVRYQNTYWRVTGGQRPSIIKMYSPEDSQTSQALPQSPTLCHCRDGQSGSPIDEKQPFPDELPPRPSPKPAEPSFFLILLKAFLLVTGLAALSAFIRRRCCSLRRRTERAAQREERRTAREYRCQARRQAIRDWWHGRRRGTPGRRPGDYDEKRTLIFQQEGVLEEVMQDEIRQLQIQEEVRQLRYTHTTIDQLVRAEEGRSRHMLQDNFQHATSSLPHGFVPISIPPRSAGESVSSSSSNYNRPITPLSRTSSLPDYISEAGQSDHPPSYKSRASHVEENDSDADVLSDYTPSTATHGSRWTPGSSIPDISPRTSIETTRTFL